MSVERFIPKAGHCEGCDKYTPRLHHGRTTTVDEGVWVCCECFECGDPDCEGREVTRETLPGFVQDRKADWLGGYEL